jgi:hypothetical protein
MTEHHEHPRIEKDLNGFGERVNEVEKTLSANEVTTNRNKEDIANVTKLVGANAEAIGLVDKSVAKLTGKVVGALAVITVVLELAKTFIPK